MITEKQLLNEISDRQKYISDNLKTITDSKLTRLKNEIEYMNYIQRVLLYKPLDAYYESELVRLERISSSVNDRFDYWCENIAPKNVDPKKFRAIFNSETGLTKINKQIKTMKFILNGNS